MTFTGHHPLRVGIVGCGKIAGNHSHALQALDDVRVIACCDTDSARASAFAAEHNIARAYPSVEQLLDAGVDAVTVCTPHPTHEAVVIAAAERGVHVLCEKPIGVDLDSADRMIAATERAGITFGVMFQRRLWPAAQRIRRAIDDGSLARPILGEVSVLLHRPPSYYSADAWRGSWDTDGGGVLMTQAIHQIDLLQWYFGPPETVTGHIRTHVHGMHMETEDSASAVISFASGATATITATTGANHNLGNRVTVIGETGVIASLLEFPEGAEAVNELWTVPGQERLGTVFSLDAPARPDIGDINAGLIDVHSLAVQDFADAVRSGRPPAVTGRDARLSLAIVAAIYQSSRSTSPVAIDAAPTLQGVNP